MALEKGRSTKNLALTIIIGVFIAIMVITLVNLIVGYVYVSPQYSDYCNQSLYGVPSLPGSSNCTFSQNLNNQVNNCSSGRGIPIYQYDSNNCPISISCNQCSNQYNAASSKYNRISFFIFAIIGFILIVVGLFISVLLLQIIALPAGAILVIEAAIKNFDDKLSVIIVLTLLVIFAIYLALKKLK